MADHTESRTTEDVDYEAMIKSVDAEIARQDISMQDFTALFGSHNAASMLERPSTFKDITSPANEFKPAKKDDRLFFEWEEHHQLGDGLHLKGHDSAAKDPNDREDKNRLAGKNPLPLENGLSFTYGEINGLAGDFFGTWYPISQDTTKGSQTPRGRFIAAYNTLAVEKNEKATKLREELQKETNFINDQVKNHGKTAHEAYVLLGQSLAADLEERSKLGDPKDPDYKQLLLLNIDHFAPNARLAYEAGHAYALELAKGGNLVAAYAANAFADHFLEDHFASGHLRVPRAAMMSIIPSNICSNFMHNEDNGGLYVKPNEIGEEWKCYGDSYLLDPKDGAETKKRCMQALKASVDEVYAYSPGQPKHQMPIDPSSFEALKYTPDSGKLAIPDKRNHAPMFKMAEDGQTVLQRKGLDDLKDDPYDWEHYEPVVGNNFKWIDALKDFGVNTYLYWLRLAWKKAPDGYYKDIIQGYADSWADGLPWIIREPVKLALKEIFKLASGRD